MRREPGSSTNGFRRAPVPLKSIKTTLIVTRIYIELPISSKIHESNAWEWAKDRYNFCINRATSPCKSVWAPKRGWNCTNGQEGTSPVKCTEIYSDCTALQHAIQCNAMKYNTIQCNAQTVRISHFPAHWRLESGGKGKGTKGTRGEVPKRRWRKTDPFTSTSTTL